MNKPPKSFTLVFLLFFFSPCKQNANESINVSSPDNEITVTFLLNDGIPYYQVSRSGKDVINASKLGFAFKEAAPLQQNLVLAGSQKSSFDETWVQPWGEVDRKSTRLNSSHIPLSRMPSSA